MQKHTHTPEQLLALLEEAIRTTPLFTYGESLTDTEIRWLARTRALIEASGALAALVNFDVARQKIGSISHSRSNLMIPLHDAFSRMELMAPIASQGAFIPAGDTWNGYAAIVKLIQKDCDDLFVIDPYIDASIYLEFAPHTLAKSGTRCLTTKRNEYHSGLVAAEGKWASDTKSTTHPVEVRYSSPGTLHDRLIIIDNKEVWIVTQSFKDIAKRSPASVSRADSEMSMMKIEHYNNLWAQSIQIP